jgi:hypothetical protein
LKLVEAIRETVAATIGIRKALCYLAFLACCTLLAMYGKPIPEELIWGTGFFFGANLLSKRMDNSSGANGGV